MAIIIKTAPLSQLTGIKLYAKIDNVNVRSNPINTAAILHNFANTGDFIGTTTGKGGFDGTVLKWVEVTTSGGLTGWAFYTSTTTIKSTSNQNANTSEEPTKSEVQSLLNQVLKNDIQLFHELLVHAQNIYVLYKKGVDISPFYAKFKPILDEYEARQKTIANNTQNIVQTINPAFTNIAEKFLRGNPFESLNGLGIPPLIGLVIGAALIAAVITTWIIYMLQTSYDAGEVNLKQSKELQLLLEKADPETRASIIKDLEGQLDNAYNKGKLAQWWKTNSWWVKILLFAGAGFVLITFGPRWLANLKNKNKTKTKK